MRDEERGEASSKRTRRAPQRILLVQPDAVLGLALNRFLAGYFASITLAASETALHALLSEGQGYDVIVVDDAAGPSALRACLSASHARARRERQQRVILLHGGRLPGPTQALPEGVRHALEKPVPGSMLLAAVDACLGPGLHKTEPRVGQRGQHLHQ